VDGAALVGEELADSRAVRRELVAVVSVRREPTSQVHLSGETIVELFMGGDDRHVAAWRDVGLYAWAGELVTGDELLDDGSGRELGEIPGLQGLDRCLQHS
jgi:hypothetical protein